MLSSTIHFAETAVSSVTFHFKRQRKKAAATLSKACRRDDSV